MLYVLLSKKRRFRNLLDFSYLILDNEATIIDAKSDLCLVLLLS